jgi:PEP-CTERM motif
LRLNTVGLAALLLVLGLGSAKASVVTFDDGANVRDSFYTSLADQGLTFTNHANGIMELWEGNSPGSNGTNNLIYTASATGFVAITLTGGGQFNLHSLDLAVSWDNIAPTDTVIINGTPLAISTADTTYTLNLDNVSEVDISGLVSQGPHGVWWTADDLTFTVAAVPEPSTWAMLILGFLGVGLMAYRRKAAARNAA